MTAEEILKVLENSDVSVDSFGYNDFDSVELGLGECKEIEKYGGEDQGSTWYSVKYFKDHDVYIRTDGYYSSYNGTEFDEGYGYEVKPAQKTITVYE